MTDKELAKAIRDMAYSFLRNNGDISEDEPVSNEEALNLLDELIN